ncbi:PilC/PilY family type IV pilus protein [Aliiglaciecola sp. CAU 1673]|uniref:PilC/PilY family type IV pilus protein n=1 Tax=Aliiglaciecola sp. CAU 1673 TaxID=3032595 RepID=UPI0023DCD4D4|nr:PilC/PilY family type IV pilus protein [Aliiglaciecola sp. CAU 1673]MDF2178223.1 PilC/PilY family type IV pilus protein [Aliiglaciecola sp. CAU 1673]
MLKRHCLFSFSSFLMMAMISAAAMGDDLEIYLGTAGNQTTYKPNVLFIMDTSGSMSNKDDGTSSRMSRVQEGLKTVLQSATNINAGLMRFSDYGGPVLYPVRDIDEPVDPEFITSVAAPSDDAHEISNVVTLGGNQVKLVEGTGTVTTGLRFLNVNIPRGAAITSAYIRFTSAQLNTGGANLTFQGELVGNASTFASGSANISARPKTVSSLSWNTNNQWPVSGELVNTPDISAVIQEVVNQGSWCGGNALNIIVTGQGTSAASNRLIMSHEEGSSLSAQLVVAYDKTSATGCISGESQYQVSSQSNNVEEKGDGYDSTGNELTFNKSNNAFIGMRFQNVAIPKNATIQSAYIEFSAYQNGSGSASFTISAANQANPDDFDPHKRYMLRDMAKTAGVTWSNIPNWSKNQSYQTPSLVTVVQQLVNRGDWVSGNAMAFIVSNFNGVRGAYTYSGKPSDAPKLVVKYQGNATPQSVATVREHLINKVDELSANGYTPIVDTLLEAVNYYGGLKVDYGLTRGNGSVSSSVRRATRVSHRLSYTGADAVLPVGCSASDPTNSACVNEYIPTPATYISPITDLQCQTNNHIVLLSDGEANNNHSVSKIEALLGKACSGNGGEECGIDLVKNISKASDSVINARITTHTIGFAANATANNYLNQLALNGGGGFYTADSSANLVDAFQSILKTVKDVNATFVSPGVAVNQLNRLTHRDELYFALFKPAEGTVWPGNLKKYKISGDVVKDKNGLDAVDDGTGFFHDNAHSYWSVLADGNDVREGGAASQLDLVRNIYYFDGPGSIMNQSNVLHESNNSITEAHLAITGQAGASTLRSSILQWARGVDLFDDDNDGSSTDVRLQMGDPIHSQPVIVNYSNTDSAILVATNQGFLHSFDAETGEENFAIIPKELLSNLYDFYQNNSTFAHVYGLDGDLVLRNNGAQQILYVGMRRGGRNYYAFDITNKTSPSLMFKIEGGQPGFEKLGQTWSRPTLTKVNIGGSTKTVLIFGGGYDVDQDSKTLRAPDVVGNAVYMVDADTGALLWSASSSNASKVLPDMKYSVPARISVVDRENDGLADHMYIADTGGQLFRLDIHQGKGANDLVTGGLLATFAKDGTVADNRRFYYGPDIAEISLANEHYYAVALGSGYRAHPLDTQIQDNFYMIKDAGVFNVDVDGNYGLPATAYTSADLYNATDHLLTSSDVGEQAIEAAAFAQKAGWYISLGSGGEKVLASPLILNYRLFFTTYVPASISTSQCAPPTGNSRAYLVELINGNAVTDLNKNDTKEHADRYATLKQTGIAPDTKILIEEITKPVVCLGTECTSAVEDANDPCKSEFECLAEQIYGRYERVQKSAWKTENEREQ